MGEGLFGLIPVALWLVVNWLYKRFKDRNESADPSPATVFPAGVTGRGPGSPPPPKFQKAYEPVEPSLWGSRVKPPPIQKKMPEVVYPEPEWEQDQPDPSWFEPEDPDQDGTGERRPAYPGGEA